jgi:transposase InsO family protein
MSPIEVNEPFEMVGVDVIGPLPQTTKGNEYLVVFTDYLTKWPEAFAVPNQESLTIAKLLVEEIICKHGAPKKLLSDRGKNFLSDLMHDIATIMKIKKVNTTAYHPQTDGLTERFNKTLIQMISMYTDKNQHDWDEFLPFVLFAYRTSVQDSVKETPFFLMYG